MTNMRLYSLEELKELRNILQDGVNILIIYEDNTHQTADVVNDHGELGLDLPPHNEWGSVDWLLSELSTVAFVGIIPEVVVNKTVTLEPRDGN